MFPFQVKKANVHEILLLEYMFAGCITASKDVPVLRLAAVSFCPLQAAVLLGNDITVGTASFLCLLQCQLKFKKVIDYLIHNLSYNRDLVDCR